ncbi:unnamed protein product [Linum tenue]|uniref:Uncharacterized protein n=1 Tax=Linum tenue TaxID=586396 RepID=A0AAV0K2E6_9ROSI|nr:unnamed protein product [Linum tenue]
MAGLKSLARLSLSSNRFSGGIPPSISTLQKLWYLNLSSNGFSGQLPGIAGLPSLVSIDLSFNNLSLGTVPNWIKDRQLSDLSRNSFELGISGFLTNASSLQSLDLSGNQLTFDLKEITLPPGISSVQLGSNRITGSLSAILNNNSSRISFLEVLNVSRNRISGPIPDSITNLTGLKRLDVSRNRVSGTLPASLGKLIDLQWIDVSVNLLAGKIPSSLLGVKRLRHANFRANRLCGEIPQGRPYNIFPASAYAHNLCLCGKPLPPCRVRK